MYAPGHFAEPDERIIRELVRSTGFGHLVCAPEDGLSSTPLPFVVDDELTSVRMHLARANPMWRSANGRALLIVAVSDAYISPGWYPSKAEHGKVVPTWNYEVVHLHGEIRVHEDPAWVGGQITDLTEHNERPLSSPWAVTDAPSEFIAKQQRAIVGVELLVDRVDAKRKLSQNRSDADQNGVIGGLRSQGAVGDSIANAMSSDRA